ncbi:MAG TPA: hypothetical protein VF984_15330 [Actinomycetota bacterium]
MEAPRLKRGLLGYQAKSVRDLLADRERMFDHVSVQAKREEGRAKEAEEQVVHLQTELQVLQDQATEQAERLGAAETETTELRADLERALATEDRSAKLEKELDELRQELFAARQALVSEGERMREAEDRIAELESAPSAGGQPGSPSTAKEVSDVLHAAEEAMSRIVEAASRQAEEQLRQTEIVHQRIREEVDRLKGWRDHVAPLVDSVRVSIEEARLRAARIGQRIQEAVDPMSEAIGDLDEQLAAIAEVSEPESAPPVIELHEVEGESEPASHDDPVWGSWR